MGGGAAMRAAAKVAGVGIMNPGLRGFPTADHPIISTGRMATRPIPSIRASSEINGDVSAAAAVQRPYYWEEVDDWEFAGGLPRIVFGGPPSLDEAKEATSQLTAALDEAYLSPKSSGATAAGSFIISDHHHHHHGDEELFSKDDTTSLVRDSPPKHVIQAFRLLHESSAAQNVVASIASDPNVWSAVLKNEALAQYLQSQKTSTFASCVDECETHNFHDETFNSEKDVPGNGFNDFFHNIRVRVEEMMTSLSSYFQNLFSVSAEADDSDKSTYGDIAATSLMGLAVMVVMLIFLKRL